MLSTQECKISTLGARRAVDSPLQNKRLRFKGEIHKSKGIVQLHQAERYARADCTKIHQQCCFCVMLQLHGNFTHVQLGKEALVSARRQFASQYMYMPASVRLHNAAVS